MLLFGLVLGTFLPALLNGFVGFDDPDYEQEQVSIVTLVCSIRISGFNDAACVLASPLLRTRPFSTVALRFGYRPGG